MHDGRRERSVEGNDARRRGGGRGNGRERRGRRVNLGGGRERSCRKQKRVTSRRERSQQEAGDREMKRSMRVGEGENEK